MICSSSTSGNCSGKCTAVGPPMCTGHQPAPSPCPVGTWTDPSAIALFLAHLGPLVWPWHHVAAVHTPWEGGNSPAPSGAFPRPPAPLGYSLSLGARGLRRWYVCSNEQQLISRHYLFSSSSASHFTQFCFT